MVEVSFIYISFWPTDSISLDSSQLAMSIHWSSYFAVHVWVFIHFSDSVSSFCVGKVRVFFSVVCLYQCCRWISTFQFSRGGPINWFSRKSCHVYVPVQSQNLEFHQYVSWSYLHSMIWGNMWLFTMLMLVELLTFTVDIKTVILMIHNGEHNQIFNLI